MGGYERALELWRRKHVTTDAELAEALNAFSITFAYHSGKIENENITYHDTRGDFRTRWRHRLHRGSADAVPDSQRQGCL